MYYAPRIFQQAGIDGDSASLIASGVNGVLNMFATVPAILFLDRLGRRMTLISGALFMGSAMILCGAVMGGTGNVVYDPETGENMVNMGHNRSASYFCIVMIYFFVAGFAYSWGPGMFILDTDIYFISLNYVHNTVGWVYPAEIYPLRIRAKATSISTAANWLMSKSFHSLKPIL